MQFKNKMFHIGKEVRIYTSFSDASDGGCRVRSLVPVIYYSMGETNLIMKVTFAC